MPRNIILQSLTYEGLLQEIEQRAATDLPTWDATNPNDIGRYILELVAAIVERHNVYANSLSNESFIATAVDPRRMTLLAHQYGYLPQTPQPEHVSLKLDFSIPAGALTTTIPKYSIRVKAAETAFTVFFENSTDIVLPGNTSSSPVIHTVVADFVEGITRTITFKSTGLDFQLYTINDVGVILDKTLPNYGIDITVNGDAYSYVPTFIWSLPGERPFRILPHIDGKCTLQFSDNFLGEKPPPGSDIVVRYRVGGGVYNFSPNKVRLPDTVPTGIILTKITQVTNSFNGSFGDTITAIKNNAYALNDFSVRFEQELQIENYGRSIGGVGRLKVSALGTLISIVVIPAGLGLPDATLINTVEQALLPRVPMGYDFTFINPSYKEVGVNLVLRTKEDPALYGNLEQSAISIINQYLHPLTTKEDGSFLQQFGGSLSIGDLYDLLNTLDVFDVQIQWKLRGQPTYVSTDLPLNIGEIVVSGRERGRYQQGTLPNVLTITSELQSSLQNNLFIEITNVGATTSLQSALITTPSTVLYRLILSTNSSLNTYSNVVSFINADVNRFLNPGTYAGIDVYNRVPVVSASYVGSGSTPVITIAPTLVTLPIDVVYLDVKITT